MKQPHNIFETHKQPPVRQEDQENLSALEKSFSHELEIILKHAEIANAGNHGIILRIRNEDISPEFLHLMQQKRIHLEKNDTAIKVLKIYQQGAGEAECAMLEQAHMVLRNAPNRSSLAGVPDPLFFYTITLEPDTVQYCNSIGRVLPAHKQKCSVWNLFRAKIWPH